MFPLLSFLCIVLSTSAQLLELNEGKVQGFDYETKKGSISEVFLNIPYAAPPVNELRFKKPQPPEKWKDVRDGTKFGPACIPIVPEAAAPSIQTSEDCLTLNIIRPKRKAPPTGFSILVFIHGGAFETGSAQEYGYKGFADIYNTKYVIVITIQYRLGVYGFFSTGDERLKGNLGLYDMTEALKFIHSNAKNFAGDPKQITVWGHGASAAAAGQLALSTVSRG
ncbi:Carboxylesterase [Oesophagostomum dentatum]|uniref:Carboxylesterase n=1 Tax=Oesophagostomum dentatum TaxID=61180 RepID=A0A0B1T564_OESDE|nr:Carboxylesterase [Oesophagostomum dentatum]